MFRGHTIAFASYAMVVFGCATQATPGNGTPPHADAGAQGSRIDGGSAPIDGSTGGGGCGSVTEGGNCQNGILSICDMGQLVTVDCMQEGAPPCQCEMDYCDCGTGDGTGLDGGTGGGDCGPLATMDACQGTVVKWCENGSAMQFDCGTVGSTCMCEMGYCDCV